jgi:hypothetical protein
MYEDKKGHYELSRKGDSWRKLVCKISAFGLKRGSKVCVGNFWLDENGKSWLSCMFF